MLAHPDPKLSLSLTTDALDIAVGVVLSQGDNEPLGLFSRKLSEAQQKHSAFNKELLAVKEAVSHFRHIGEGQSLVVYTDHKPLTTVMESTTTRTPRQERHLSYISEFTTDLRHVKGTENIVVSSCGEVPNARGAGSSGTFPKVL